MSYWDEVEALEQERFDADLEMAELEAAGRRYGKMARKSKALRSAGKLAEAARACPHGAGYPLNSEAATNSKDPHAGETGIRCTECGSRLTDFPFDGECTVLVPCEIPGR